MSVRGIKSAKPCPFCGNTKITYVSGEDGWFIGCRYVGKHDACNALIGDSHSKRQLLKMWNNRRKSPTPRQEQ